MYSDFSPISSAEALSDLPPLLQPKEPLSFSHLGQLFLLFVLVTGFLVFTGVLFVKPAALIPSAQTDANQQPIAANAVCGNKVCEQGESVDTCILDCWVCNENGVCEADIGENSNSCATDCPAAVAGVCDNDGVCDLSEDAANCASDCPSAVVALCGNAFLDQGEACDGSLLDGHSCTTEGFSSGVLLCNSTCTGFGTGACVNAVLPACGNGKKEGTEACDGTDLNGSTCISSGFAGGVLSCRTDCASFDVSSCTNTLCADGLDNDGDGYPDRSDNDCFAGSVFVASRTESNAQSGCNPNPDPLNVVQNGALECPSLAGTAPDHWWMPQVSAGYSGRWVSDPLTGNSFLQSINDGTSDHNVTPVWLKNDTLVKPDTWYELSFSMAIDGLKPPLNADKTINSAFVYTGLNIYARTSNFGYTSLAYGPEFVSLSGPELSDWDDSVKVYRTYRQKPLEGWKRIKVYVKTPSDVKYLQLGLVNYADSNVLVDDIVLHELSSSPLIAFQKSGSLTFQKFKGADFFPIVLGGIPDKNETGGAIFNYDRFVSEGFNTIARFTFTPSTSWAGGIISSIVSSNLAVVPGVGYLTGSNVNILWVDDPSHQVAYSGWANLKAMVDGWTGFPNLLAIELPDELNGGGSTGVYLPELRGLKESTSYIRSKGMAVHADFYPGMYTGQAGDLTAFLSQVDSATFTQNTFRAYPPGRLLQPEVGMVLRNAAKLSRDSGLSNRFWAYGLGVYWWSNWDVYEWHFNKFIPFNLQRFQIWNQVVNGAVGAEFWGTQHTDMTDTYYRHQYEQIVAIAKGFHAPLSGGGTLYDVLLEKQFVDQWTASDPHIEAMLKQHNGKWYLFGTSTAYQDLSAVSFSFPFALQSVTALDEQTDQSVCVGKTRSVALTGSNSFSDDFKQQKGFVADASGNCVDFYGGADPTNAPGYAVHIYEITPA
jgi:hypothetical protein